MLLKVIRQWIQQIRCSHENRILESIAREPITYTRQACYYCPDCQRNWTSCRLPDSVTR